MRGEGYCYICTTSECPLYLRLTSQGWNCKSTLGRWIPVNALKIIAARSLYFYVHLSVTCPGPKFTRSICTDTPQEKYSQSQGLLISRYAIREDQNLGRIHRHYPPNIIKLSCLYIYSASSKRFYLYYPTSRQVSQIE